MTVSKSQIFTSLCLYGFESMFGRPVGITSVVYEVEPNRKPPPPSIHNDAEEK